jgi:DNA-binding GntR family transcriptional regulator
MAKEPVPGSLTLQAYDRLRDEILKGIYPRDQLISEQAIASRLGMSRTPVRTAIAQLEADGLVRILPQRGIVVDEVTPRELTEIFQFREALETFAAENADEIDKSRLMKLGVVFEVCPKLATPINDRSISLILSEADEQLHRTIVASTNNRLMLREFDRMRLKLAQIRALSWSINAGMAAHRGLTAAAIEHRGIIDALVAGDRKLAAMRVREHLRAGREHMLQSAAAQRAEDVPSLAASDHIVDAWLRDRTLTFEALPGIVATKVSQLATKSGSE